MARAACPFYFEGVFYDAGEPLPAAVAGAVGDHVQEREEQAAPETPPQEPRPITEGGPVEDADGGDRLSREGEPAPASAPKRRSRKAS